MSDTNDCVHLAEQIATAVIAKLQLTSLYMVAVRRYADPCPMPWIEISFCRIGRDPVTNEHCICLPESHYKCETKEQRSNIAQYIYKSIAMMVGKLEPKDK